MIRMAYAAAAAALALGTAPAAIAASDYLLVIGGKDGAAPSPIEILSWSWGATNSGAGSTGGATATDRMRESPTLPSRDYTPRNRVAAGDVNGDGLAELSAAAEVQGFTLRFDKASPQLFMGCVKGSRLEGATIRAGTESFELVDAVISSCPGDQPAAARAGGPPRASWDLATLKGGRSASPAAAGACASGQCQSITIAGQLKHTKSGHVTLLK